MSQPADRLEAYEEQHGLRLDRSQRRQLREYLGAVLLANQDVNLTGGGLGDLASARARLELPSYAVASGWGSGPAPRIALDIGSGNGYPGVVAAVIWPSARVLLVERRKKKAAAIQGCLAQAGISNAEVLAEDVRDAAAHRPELRDNVDLVMARGVGSTAGVNRLAAPFLAPGGRVMHWKATNTSPTELREGDVIAGTRGWSARVELRFEPVPPGPGRLVVYERPARGAR